jgi:thymidylate kinase
VRADPVQSETVASLPDLAPLGIPSSSRGRVITIVGPDGTGKTTLCTSLAEALLADRQVRVLANRSGATRPGFLPHRKVRGPTTEPHRHPPYPAWLSIAKSFYVFADFAVGWFVRVRPFVRRGGWVVVERGWWDVVVDPRRYRLRDSPRVAGFLGRRLPRSDLVLILEAAPDVIRRRKAQLSIEEIERQRHAWHRVLPAKQRRAFLDASMAAVEVARAACLQLRAVEPDGGGSEKGDPSVRIPDDGQQAAFEDRWLPLLRRLTERFPQWIVWKNADAGLGGHGDIDAVAPVDDWDGITEEFIRWASRQALGPALVCRHVPGSMFLVAADPRSGVLFELDVKANGTHRGKKVFGPRELLPMTRMDPRGFRRLRPGAEGMFKLALNGLRRTGAPRPERLAKERVRELLESDPDGLRQAARLFRGARAPARRLAEGVAQGGQPRRTPGLLVEVWAHAGAVAHPAYLLRRARFRVAGRRVCPGVKTLVKWSDLADRTLATWPQDVQDRHTVDVAGR